MLPFCKIRPDFSGKSTSTRTSTTPGRTPKQKPSCDLTVKLKRRHYRRHPSRWPTGKCRNISVHRIEITNVAFLSRDFCKIIPQRQFPVRRQKSMANNCQPPAKLPRRYPTLHRQRLLHLIRGASAIRVLTVFPPQMQRLKNRFHRIHMVRRQLKRKHRKRRPHSDAPTLKPRHRHLPLPRWPQLGDSSIILRQCTIPAIPRTNWTIWSNHRFPIDLF